ncbi:MAG: mitochondrial fission ELM1 family protein [Rhodospirillaceae bacterium]
MEQPLIWVLTDDRAGNVAQALGVAEALGRPFTVKGIRYTPLAKLPSALLGASLLGLTGESRAGFVRPWPDLVIAAGRRTAPVGRWIKKQSGGQTRIVQIMDPGRRSAADVDLIAVPRHDGAFPGGDAANVLRITGAPHRMTADRLAAAAENWSPRFNMLSRPFIAVMVGGATHSRPFPAPLAADLGRRAAELAAQVGGSILLTTSRRTGAAAEAALLAAIPEPRYVFLWSRDRENKDDNPYQGYLALADRIVVTGDSVSMCSEACATGKPVHIYAPADMVGAKHARLHRELYDLGLAMPLDTPPVTQGRPQGKQLNAARDVALAIEERFLGGNHAARY